MSWLLQMCCYEHWDACIFSNYTFLWMYAWEWDCCLIWQLYFQGLAFFFFFFSFLRNFHIGCSNLLFYQESAGEFPFLHTSSAAAAKSLQSYPTLWDPIDGSPPGTPIPGILQARTLEWVAISFSNAWKWKVKVKSLSRIRLFATPWTAAYQAPLSMGFSRQQYWSGVPLPFLGIICNHPLFYKDWLIVFISGTVLGSGDSTLNEKDEVLPLGRQSFQHEMTSSVGCYYPMMWVKLSRLEGLQKSDPDPSSPGCWLDHLVCC